MHISNDVNDFRNERYLKEMELDFKRMFRAYHRFIAYRNKLLNELTLSDTQKELLNNIDVKFVRNVNRVSERVKKDDFKGNVIL